MDFEFVKESSLNLHLAGTVGSFKVSGAQSSSSLASATDSLEVMFFLTHVNLDFNSSNSSDLLQHLAPVREIYEPETLEFDEIMQRDLDDARVSSELIPYLLDAKNRDLVKIFPPIIVVVLPTEPDSERPADLYPKVMRIDREKASMGKHEATKIRSGDISREVFEFEYPVESDGSPRFHDFARLHLNTSRTKLVIVDGQHRAMALLAIYRNLKNEWSKDTRRQPYKDYYAEWTESYIKGFKLDQLSMPIMFCAFPDLDESYRGDYNLKKAARAVFLALNKNAKKVSDSRNKLLDDNDLISYFLRKTLSSIKGERKTSLRIWNVELDQTLDKTKLASAVALTGVNHIYYLIEHLLLNDQEVVLSPMSARRGNYALRSKLDEYNAIDRLNAKNMLGMDSVARLTRGSYTGEEAEKLSEQYMNSFGQVILYILKEFKPFAYFSTVTLDVHTIVAANNQKLKSILFDGQGVQGVFEQHRSHLKDELKKDGFSNNRAEVESLITQLDAQKMEIDKTIEAIHSERALKLIDALEDKSRVYRKGAVLAPAIRGFVDKLYSNVLTTVAFQTALVSTYIGLLEQAFGVDFWYKEPEKNEAELTNYLACIESLFCPVKVTDLKRLVAVFEGSLVVSSEDMSAHQINRTDTTFKPVVMTEEMKPDLWPKYRYILLELWRPLDGKMEEVRQSQLVTCRQIVLQGRERVLRDRYLKEVGRGEDSLTDRQRASIKKKAVESYRTFLGNLAPSLVAEPLDLDSLFEVTVEGYADDYTTGLEDSSEEG